MVMISTPMPMPAMKRHSSSPSDVVWQRHDHRCRGIAEQRKGEDRAPAEPVGEKAEEEGADEQTGEGRGDEGADA